MKHFFGSKKRKDKLKNPENPENKQDGKLTNPENPHDKQDGKLTNSENPQNKQGDKLKSPQNLQGKQNSKLTNPENPQGKQDDKLKKSGSPQGKQDDKLKNAASPQVKEDDKLKSSASPQGKQDDKLKNAASPQVKEDNKLKSSASPQNKQDDKLTNPENPQNKRDIKLSTPENRPESKVSKSELSNLSKSHNKSNTVSFTSKASQNKNIPREPKKDEKLHRQTIYRSAHEGMGVDREDNMSWSDDDNHPKPPFPLRMIDTIDHNSGECYNTHEKLIKILIHPLAKKETFYTEEYLQARFISNKNKKSKRHILCISLIFVIILILFELVYLFIGCFFTTNCTNLGNYLIISVVFHLIIIISEWFRYWFRDIYSHRDSRGAADFCAIITTGVLILLYMFCLVWFSIGFSWIWIPYTEAIYTNSEPRVLEIYYEGHWSYIITYHCSLKTFHAVIVYQLYVIFISSIRAILFGFGNACKGICIKMVENQSINKLKIPYVASSYLPDIIPKLGSIKYDVNNKNRLKFNYLGRVHDKPYCMIHNHPQWVKASDIV